MSQSVWCLLKGTVQQKWLTVFCITQKCLGKKTLWANWFSLYWQKKKCLYRFGTIWGWV